MGKIEKGVETSEKEVKRVEASLEQVVMKLIMKGGDARSLSIRAIQSAEKGNLNEADLLILEANEAINQAHDAQADVIRKEITGSHIPVSLLLVHAQDHVMNAMTVRDLAIHIIQNQKDIQSLKNLLKDGVME